MNFAAETLQWVLLAAALLWAAWAEARAWRAARQLKRRRLELLHSVEELLRKERARLFALETWREQWGPRLSALQDFKADVDRRRAESAERAAATQAKIETMQRHHPGGVSAAGM
jgi:hypothetical protein